MPEHEIPKGCTTCIQVVRPDPIFYWPSKYCTRKRGHGPEKAYCRQHAKILEG